MPTEEQIATAKKIVDGYFFEPNASSERTVLVDLIAEALAAGYSLTSC